MLLILHDTQQETESGNSEITVEPELRLQSLTISVTQISVNLLGTITFKVQHSADGTNWFDVANLGTGGLNSTGAVLISLSSSVPILDHIRLVWTFSNSNSVTFKATVLGIR